MGVASIMGNILKIKNIDISRDELSEVLNAFDKYYLEHSIDDGNDPLFGVSAKKIKEVLGLNDSCQVKLDDTQLEYIESIKKRIIDELVNGTSVYIYDRSIGLVGIIEMNESDIKLVEKDEILRINDGMRPQLTSRYISVDIGYPSYKSLIFYYKKYLESEDKNTKVFCYNQFRLGLDILDLDPITYRLLNNNRN